MAMQREAGMLSSGAANAGWKETRVDAIPTLAEAGIDENLCRAELSPSDRAKQTARRKAIYLELHPETAHGTPGVSRQVGDTRERADADRFTAETAKVTGASERSVQRDAERGEKIIDAAIDVIRGTVLDTGSVSIGIYGAAKTKGKRQ